MTFIDIYVNLV